MNQINIRSWLYRTWDAVLRTAEAMDVSPIEDIHDRLARLEREVAAIKDAPRCRHGHAACR